MKSNFSPLLSLAILLLILLPHPTNSQSPLPAGDATCETGLLSGNVCCPSRCGTCGGKGCGERGRQAGTICCRSGILSRNRICGIKKPPCVLPPSPSPAPTPVADPTCATGILRKGACCPVACERCGGPGCKARGIQIDSSCCAGSINRKSPSCNDSFPPCTLTIPVVTPVTSPVPSPLAATPSVSALPSVSSIPSQSPSTMSSPSVQPKSNVSTITGAWQTAVVTSGNVAHRHEACAVMVDGLLVLLGGRGRNKPVSIYDPSTGVWTNREGAGEGILIHHFQCVAAEGKVWIASSWRGKFPREKNNALIYIYDVANDSWSTAKGLPVDRRRGGAAAVKRGDFIYVVGGNRGGHGGHAKTLTWMDAYNYKTNTWTVNLPSMPEGSGRDHTGGALVNDKLCIAGGRDGGQSSFFEANVESTYCYDFETEVWERKQDFPSPRAGAMTGATCDGRMMIAGGEGNGQAYDLVHVFNGSTWEQGPSLVRARHGSGLAVTNCSCGHIFIPSGSGAQAGRPELRSTEQYVPEGASNTCDIY